MTNLRLLALSGAAVLAIGAGPAAAQEDIKIGMVNLSLCCAYFVGMDAAVKDEATHFSNVSVLSTDAGGDAAKLTDDVEDLLNQGVNALIISGAWLEAAPAALDSIQQAGVPVVMVDRLLKGGEFTSWVGPDNRAIGEGIGDYIVERLGDVGADPLADGAVVGSDPAGEISALEQPVDHDHRHAGLADRLERRRRRLDPGSGHDQRLGALVQQVLDVLGQLRHVAAGVGREDRDVGEVRRLVLHRRVHANEVGAAQRQVHHPDLDRILRRGRTGA